MASWGTGLAIKTGLVAPIYLLLSGNQLKGSIPSTFSPSMLLSAGMPCQLNFDNAKDAHDCLTLAH